MERSERLPGEWIGLPDALLYWEPDYLCRAGLPADLFARLAAQVAWQQHRIRLYGRELAAPRLSAWYGDPGARYRYSGLQLEPEPWLPPLLQLREALQGELSHAFNSVLLNYYRSGADSMGPHADDEPELGAEPVIATLSLGAPRRFILRRRDGSARWQCELGDGSLLVMAGACQHHWRHAVPKTRRPVAGRISLTFRRVGTAL